MYNWKGVGELKFSLSLLIGCDNKDDNGDNKDDKSEMNSFLVFELK